MSTSIRRFVAFGSLAIAAGLALPTTLVRAQSKPKLDDPTIVAIFDAANTYDIETGAVGEKKAKSHDVHEFAEMLQRDHRAVRKQGRDLAASLKVTPTPPSDFALAKAHTDAMAKLRSLSG